MDVQTASGPALPLGIAVAVGVLALALATALLISWRRPPRPPTAPSAPPPGSYPDDDLPSFREHPPGFPGARPVPAGATTRTANGVAAPGHNPVRTLTVLALLALLLVGVAAAVAAIAAAADGGPAAARSTGTTAAPAGALAARAAFGGVVLERHPAGITVAYPTLTADLADPTTAQAHLRLPMWNCMTDRPPADPAGAGCRATVPEYADLPAPALRAARDGDGLQLRGRFPTYVHPPGGEAVATGRVYDLAVTLRPGRRLPDGWTAASGELSLAGGQSTALGDGATALRPGG